MIVKIVQELKKKKPNIKAVIGGTGPEKDKIFDLINKLDLKNNISVCGYIPDAELNSFFNKGRVFVLTSETEGFPRTIVQAALCGLPVVTSNVGDIIDVIDDQLNGFIVNDYRNIQEYASKIDYLLNDSTLYDKFSINLNKKIKENFAIENAGQIWQDILDRI